MGLYSDFCHLVVQISVSNKQQNVSVSMKRFCIPIILICAVNLFRVFFFKRAPRSPSQRSPSQRSDNLNYHKTKIQETDVFKRLDKEFFLETVNQISQILYVQNSRNFIKNKSKEQKHD